MRFLEGFLMPELSIDFWGLMLEFVIMITIAVFAFAKLKNLIDRVGDAVTSLNESVSLLRESLANVKEAQAKQTADIAVLQERTNPSHSSSLGD